MAEEDGFRASLIAELHKPPALLPIAQLKQSLLYAIEIFPVTIIVSARGIEAAHLLTWLIDPVTRSERQAAERLVSKVPSRQSEVLINFDAAQIPQYLFEAGWTNDGSQIAITQPRRIAATVCHLRNSDFEHVLTQQ